MVEKVSYSEGILNRLSVSGLPDACLLLDLMSEIESPPKGGAEFWVNAAMATAVRFDQDVVYDSAVAVIVEHNGRALLQERFCNAIPGSKEEAYLKEFVDRFNKQEGIKPIEIPEKSKLEEED
jgi:hypothetical protein